MKTLLVLAVILLSIMLSLGCVSKPTTKPDQVVVSAVVSPLKVVVMQDRTGSVDTTRTPRIAAAEIDELIEIVKRRTGEIAFGFIDNDSNESLVRLRITAPPVAPVEPDNEGNPYKVAERVAAYRKAKAAYDKEQTNWQNDVDRRVETFKSTIQPMIEDKKRYGATDIIGGLTRADLFLSESRPGSGMGQQTNVIVLITDGLDNVRRTPEEIKSGATIVLVNSSHSKGVLSKYQTETFESIEAAFRFVAELQGTTTSAANGAGPGSRMARSIR